MKNIICVSSIFLNHYAKLFNLMSKKAQKETEYNKTSMMRFKILKDNFPLLKTFLMTGCKYHLVYDDQLFHLSEKLIVCDFSVVSYRHDLFFIEFLSFWDQSMKLFARVLFNELSTYLIQTVVVASPT